jgi:hypothetical protein
VNIQATQSQEGRAVSAERQRASDLLGRYPRLTEAEVREIVTFLKTGRQLEIGLLTSDPALRPRLDAFMAEHKAEFRLKWTESVAVAAGVFGVPTGLWLLWEALT